MNFILLSTQRSGSTWVIDMLNSHPQIKSYSELLLENAEGKPKWGGEKDNFFFNNFLKLNGNPKSKDTIHTLLNNYLDSIYSVGNQNLSIGFKLMYGQAGEYPVLSDYIISRKLNIIHLIRRNIIDIIISKELAHKRDIYHSKKEVNNDISIKINTKELISRIEWEENQVLKAKKRFSSLKVPYLEIYYEDLLNEQRNFHKVLNFLKLKEPYPELNSPLKRLNKQSYSESISNYNEVKEILKNTKYESFITSLRTISD